MCLGDAGWLLTAQPFSALLSLRRHSAGLTAELFFRAQPARPARLRFADLPARQFCLLRDFVIALDRGGGERVWATQGWAIDAEQIELGATGLLPREHLSALLAHPQRRGPPLRTEFDVLSDELQLALAEMLAAVGVDDAVAQMMEEAAAQHAEQLSAHRAAEFDRLLSD